MDLSLEINRAKTVTRALQHFTAKETLDGDNKYRCPKNNKLVGAAAESELTVACMKAQNRHCQLHLHPGLALSRAQQNPLTNS